MFMRPTRPKAVLVAVAVLALAPTASSIAATTKGSVALQDPASRRAYSETVPIAWNFRPGTKVKTTSALYLQATADGYRWHSIASRLPIRQGSATWDTSGWAEGFYYVRAVVHGTLISSQVGPIVVDRTAPWSEITQPREGHVVVDNSIVASTAVVVGTTTLAADAFDHLSGVGTITWLLDGDVIAEGSPVEYNFSLQPGPHTLTAQARDRAGNITERSVRMMAGPGPSLVVNEIPEPEAPEQPEVPGLPDHSELPDPPEVPGLPGSELPNPAPPSGPSTPDVPSAPDPDELPFP